MKRILFFIPFLCLFILLGCKGGNSKATESENAVPLFCHEDTVEVETLVRSYLDSLKAGNYKAALFLLYHIEGGKVYNLTDFERNDIKQQWQSLPVTDYSIDSICLFRNDSCRAYYSIKLFDKPEGSDIPNTMQISLAPQRVDNIWYLGLNNKSGTVTIE